MFCCIIFPNASCGLVISYAAKRESAKLEAHHCVVTSQRRGAKANAERVKGGVRGQKGKSVSKTQTK